MSFTAGNLVLIRENLDQVNLKLLYILTVLICLLLGIFRAVYLLYFHPLSKIPGPTLAALSTWWQKYYAAKLLKADQIQAAHLKYGDIVRIGPNELSFSNPRHLKAIYGHNVPVLKTEFYAGGKFTSEDNVFSMRNRDQHAARRKLMSRNFAQAPLMELAPDLMRKAQALCSKLEELGSGTINVYPWLHRLGLEFIFMLTLGRDFKLTETDTHHHALRNLEVFPENFAITAIFPFLKKHGVDVPIKSIRTPFEIQAGWEKYCLEIVAEERAKMPEERSSWIKRLMDRDDDFLGRPLRDLEIAEEIVGVLFAGSGTASSTLAFLIYSVVADQKIYAKLKRELHDELPDWPVHGDVLPDINAIQHLPYLNAVVNETLRRFPTIPGSMPRRIVSDNVKIDKLELRKDTIVSAQNYSLHMHEEYYPSPEMFDPERFLGPDQKKARDGLNAFSEGPRACLGRNLAVLELQIVTSLFFRYFDVKMDPSMKADDMAMKVVFSGSPSGEKVLLNLRKVTS
ncbi:uncharacterized protein Z518_09071 [Rhinocladiella mackenziei CBS 650.93]|uniref:Cytochrome P450 monooxygenase n=1 Tax=Rhinocladiella mackenziei CBS 650.93 TaxID=1442369 RepID=A0A0D2IDM7_9EURO|nr:uncharacterized protein Z518_09071 [Rhinocladiella mackenziei CBS 650.93]KIX01346.1 hypothetical protein Z518_09071 [Rhinocladiella mackenziei CBS 650.93]